MAMNIILWILQVVLTVVFAAHGWLLVSPPPELVEAINQDMGVGFRFAVGIAEILGAIGILIPGITRIKPHLTEISAACFVLVSVGATIWHLVRGEMSSVPTTGALIVISAFVAYGRWRLRPIPPRHVASAEAGSASI